MSVLQAVLRTFSRTAFSFQNVLSLSMSLPFVLHVLFRSIPERNPNRLQKNEIFMEERSLFGKNAL